MHPSALMLLCGIASWLGVGPGPLAPAVALPPAAPREARVPPATTAPPARDIATDKAPGADVAAARPAPGTAMVPPPALMAPSPGPEAPAMGASPAVGEAGDWKPYDYGKAGGAKKGLAPGTLVVIAYGLIWGVLLVYVAMLARRQRRLREELDALRDLLSRRSEVPTRAVTDPAEASGGREK